MPFCGTTLKIIAFNPKTGTDRLTGFVNGAAGETIPEMISLINEEMITRHDRNSYIAKPKNVAACNRE